MKCNNFIKFLILSVCMPACLFSTVVTQACGVINIDKFRNTEQVARIDEFPWIAGVVFNISGSIHRLQMPFLCQAVLISQRHLLAVADCVDEELSYIEPYAVVLGAWNNSFDYTEKICDDIIGKCSTPNLIEIDTIIVHPLYSSLRQKTNIALLRLTQPVMFSDYIRPICLPDKVIADKQFGSEELKLAGWFLQPGSKQKMSVFMYNQQDFRRKFSTVESFSVTSSHLCGISGNIEEDFYNGAALMDLKGNESSGRVDNAYLVGLLAFGIKSSFDRNQHIFIRIDRYLDWIEKNMY